MTDCLEEPMFFPESDGIFRFIYTDNYWIPSSNEWLSLAGKNRAGKLCLDKELTILFSFPGHEEHSNNDSRRYKLKKHSGIWLSESDSNYGISSLGSGTSGKLDVSLAKATYQMCCNYNPKSTDREKNIFYTKGILTKLLGERGNFNSEFL